MKDKAILLAIEKGDPDRVMDILYKNEYPKLENYIKRNSGTKEDARDVFQEAVIILFTHVKLKKFNPQYEVGAFLYVVGCNKWKQNSKKSASTLELKEEFFKEAFENPTYDQLYSKESKGIVKNLFDQLGENCKKILELSIFYDYSLKDLCHALGYESEDTVKTRRYKCKQKLIAMIQENPQYANFLKENLRREND